MTVKPGSWTVFFFWKRVCFGGSNHTAMVYREKYSLYIPEKKTRHLFWGSIEFSGFQIWVRGHCFPGTAGRGKGERNRTHKSLCNKLPSSQLALLDPYEILVHGLCSPKIYCSIPQQYQGGKTCQSEKWSWKHWGCKLLEAGEQAEMCFFGILCSDIFAQRISGLEAQPATWLCGCSWNEPPVLGPDVAVAYRKLSKPSVSHSQSNAVKCHRTLLFQVWSPDQQHQRHQELVRNADARPRMRILNQNLWGSGARGLF